MPAGGVNRVRTRMGFLGFCQRNSVNGSPFRKWVFAWEKDTFARQG